MFRGNRRLSRNISGEPIVKIALFHYGIDYAPKDLKFSLMDSAKRNIGNPVEQFSLCRYHCDPSTGKYGLAILSVLRLMAVATILGLGGLLLVFWRKNKSRKEDLK